MISVIPDYPSHVGAFRVTGKVTSADYRNVVIPELRRIAARTDKINVIMVLETDVSNYSIGAWITDFVVDVRYLFRWHRAAVVSDQMMVSIMSAVANWVIPGNIRVYLPKTYGQARAWVAAPAT